MTLTRRDLHEDWALTVVDGPIPFPVRDLPATVPGTFLTDLLEAGLIPDPYLDRNEHELAWSGECDLLYRTAFTLDEVPAGRGEHHDGDVRRRDVGVGDQAHEVEVGL